MRYVIDIDDTLLCSDFDGKEYKLKGVNVELVKKINNLFTAGNIIILYTGRHWNHLEITLKQLMEIEIKYHTLILGKPDADYYIDDKAITPEDFLNEH